MYASKIYILIDKYFNQKLVKPSQMSDPSGIPAG